MNVSLVLSPVQAECWCCGQPVEAMALISGQIVTYECRACEVTYRFGASPNTATKFTDPEVMRTYGLVDHATVHRPAPA